MMPAPVTPRRWQRIAKIAFVGLAAIVAVPFIIVALFGAAGGRR